MCTLEVYLELDSKMDEALHLRDVFPYCDPLLVFKHLAL
jgi:hypothetical protein